MYSQGRHKGRGGGSGLGRGRGLGSYESPPSAYPQTQQKSDQGVEDIKEWERAGWRWDEEWGWYREDGAVGSWNWTAGWRDGGGDDGDGIEGVTGEHQHEAVVRGMEM